VLARLSVVLHGGEPVPEALAHLGVQLVPVSPLQRFRVSEAEDEEDEEDGDAYGDEYHEYTDEDQQIHDYAEEDEDYWTADHEPPEHEPAIDEGWNDLSRETPYDIDGE